MKTRSKETARSNGAWQGMNWIRPEKRLAIYLRDGLRCGWCFSLASPGSIFTLDHLKPHSRGGSNHESNLVACCHRCNTSRGSRGQKAFAQAVASYINHGLTEEAILARIRATSRLSIRLFLAEARALIEKHGNFSKAMCALTQSQQEI